MTDTRQPNEELQRLAEDMGPSAWESARQTSIGGAGVSTALVLLLAQLELRSCLLVVSFYSAAAAIPIWLGLWQVGNAYAVRSKAKTHFVRIGAFVGSGLFLLAGACTFVSLATLIASFSLGASVVFVSVSLVMCVFVTAYHVSVSRDSGGA